MLRKRIFIIIGMFALLLAWSCNSTSVEETSMTPSLTVAPTEANADQLVADSAVQIWCLGGNSWALRIGEKMLIFDYAEMGDPNPPSRGEPRNLQSGYIDPNEIKSYEVYVFVTHSHQDHFNRVIFEWENQIDQISYIFGWQADNNPDHYYLIDPRAQIQVDGVEVYTINSFSDVPEVAYLVKVDGLFIYHNGDYRGSYIEDFEYLQTITDHIDIVFVIGWPYLTHQHFQQAKLLAEMFNPNYLFAICRETTEDKCRQFADLLAAQGIATPFLYAEHRGIDFILSKP